MIDARSGWNVKDGQTKFYEYYLKRVFENLENLVTKSPHYGIIEKKYVLENTHGDNNGW